MIQVLDTFTGVDTTALNLHAPDTDRAGGGWAMPAGAWTLQSNQAGTTSVALARAAIDTGIYDGRFKADVIVGTATGVAGVCFRGNAGLTNYWQAILDDSSQEVQLQIVTAGAPTTVGIRAFAQDEATSYELKVICDGDEIDIFVDDVLMLEYVLGTYNTQQYAGLFAPTNVAARFDDFVADARPTCYYCTTADVKADFGEQWTSGVKYDAMLENAIEEASRLIDRELGWEDCHFAASDLATVIRYYDGIYEYEMTADRFLDDAAFAVAVDDDADGIYTAWVRNTDYITWPYNGDYIQKLIVKTGASVSFVGGQRAVQVTGRIGAYLTPPAEIKKAAIITVARWFKRGMQAYQDTGAIEELGQLIYTKALDPDVAEILSKTPRRIHYG